MRRELGIDPIEIDVGMVLQRSVASLYSHLVTRPTGRAVRLAIESQLAETERPSLSMIDLSEVEEQDACHARRGPRRPLAPLATRCAPHPAQLAATSGCTSPRAASRRCGRLGREGRVELALLEVARGFWDEIA